MRRTLASRIERLVVARTWRALLLLYLYNDAGAFLYGLRGLCSRMHDVQTCMLLAMTRKPGVHMM